MISHLFKNDLRRSRILLGAWALLIAAQCPLASWNVNPGDQAMKGAYVTISLLIPLFQVLMLVVIVPHVVQEEPLVGTTAFWFTRPISRSTLLKEKALFGALLIGLPLVVEVCVLAANGVAARDLGLAVPEIMLEQFVTIASIATLAALTPSFGKFAIAGVVILFVSILVSTTVSLVGLYHGPAAILAKISDFALMKSRTIANHLVLAIGAGSVLVSQYLTRRTGRSVVLAVLVVALSVTTANFWPWTFLRRGPAADAGERFDPAALTLSLVESNSYDMGSFRGTATKERVIRAAIATSGLPAGYLALPKAARPQLTLLDGTKIDSHAPEDTMAPAYIPGIAPLEVALGGVPIVNSVPSDGPEMPILAMSGDAFREHSTQPLRLTADLDMVVSKYVVVAEMPVVRGSRFDRGSEHLVLTDILHDGTGVDIMAEHRDVSLLFDGASKPPNPMSFTLNSGDTVYLLCNEKRHQAIIQKQEAQVGFWGPSANYGPLEHQSLEFSFGPSGTFLTPDLTDAWLADAKLVRLQLVPVGSFSKRLVYERFKLEGPNRSPSKSSAKADSSAGAVAMVALPANPTKAQAREYVDTLLALSQREAHTGLLTDMLKKVGHEHIDVLLDVQDTFRNGRLDGALDSAVEQIAQPEDKKLILGALEKHPLLVDVVVKNDWAADARETLLAGLRDTQERALPADWIRAVASLKDPATYPDLEAYLVRCRRKQETFNAIRKLPGIELADTVDLAWKQAKLESPGEVLAAAGMAAGYGHIDALDELAKILKDDESSSAEQTRATNIIKHYTTATGNGDAVVAWIEANRGRLVFDPEAKRYVLAPPKP
jgi:hypothetical protein